MEILINAHRNLIFKAILKGFLFIFEVKNIYSTGFGINNPVFPHACSTIFKQFNSIINSSRAGRNNFYNPVRCTITSFAVYFIFITYYRNIRFKIFCIISKKKNRKRCRKNNIDANDMRCFEADLRQYYIEWKNN